MEFFGWAISRRTDDSLPTHLLVAAGAAAIAIGYPIGYLLIDILQWITLTADQTRDGYVHVFRMFAGFVVVALPMIGWMAWDSHGDLRELSGKK